MRKISITLAVVCFCVYFMVHFYFSIQIKSDNNDTDKEIDMQQLDLINPDTIVERYIEESKKLKEEFTPIWERLEQDATSQGKYGKEFDLKKWETEYYRPLFEKSRQAMIRITGNDDYLTMWEKEIPKQIFSSIDQNELESIYIPIGSNLGDYSLFTIHTLSIIGEQHARIIEGTFYGNSKAQKKMIQPLINNEDMIDHENMMMGMRELGSVTDISENEYPFLARTPFTQLTRVVHPAFFSGTTYDGEYWFIMAIYSFKNDRARDILFDLAISSDSFADCAVYFLPFFPNAGELLTKLQPLIEEAEVTEQRDQQEIVAQRERWARYRGADRELVAQEREIYQAIQDRRRAFDRLLALKRSLEFNEKIPVEERELFDAFRRELAISWSLCCKTIHGTPNIFAILNKGDEHFEIYLREYPYPWRAKLNIRWEDDGDSDPYPYTQANPYWQKRKAFYERELANPRPIYTENQLEYLRGKNKEMERMK